MFIKIMDLIKEKNKKEIAIDILNSHNRVLSFSRNNIGLIDLNAELTKGNLIFIDDKFIDAKTGLLYRFKSNKKSGGPSEGRKELYESLISRMVAKFGKTVEYFPAEFNKERGVFCLDWSNECPHNKYFTLSYITDSQTLHELESDSSLIRKCSKTSLKSLKKLPQHFIVGNCDYTPRNIAYKNGKDGKIDEILFFDYGFSSFSRIESSLIRRNLQLNTSNIRTSYIDNIWGYTNSLIGMGPRYNLCSYCYLESIMADFKSYSKTSKEFKKNIKESIPIAECFDEEIKRMRDDGFKVYPDHENIIQQVNDINLENYEKLL